MKLEIEEVAFSCKSEDFTDTAFCIMQAVCTNFSVVTPRIVAIPCACVEILAHERFQSLYSPSPLATVLLQRSHT